MSNPGVWSFVSNAFKDVKKLVDDLHMPDDARLLIKQEMYALQNETANKLLDYEVNLLSKQARVIIAEAQGQSWLQRSWRPITMLTFLVLVVCDSFGLLAFRLSEQAWTLLNLGFGGYVAGRSLEKVSDKMAPIFKKEK